MIWLAALTVRADNCPTLIRTFDSDAYQSSFFSRTYSPSFYAGEDPYGEYRSFFIFNIPTLTQTVVSAELWLSKVTLHSVDASELFELDEVTNSVATVESSFSSPDVYADLGDGAYYGSHLFTVADNDQTVVIPLNNVFISKLLASSGGQIILGGHITTLNSQQGDFEFLSVTYSNAPYAAQLAITFPESGSLHFLRQPDGGAFLEGQERTLQAFVCGLDPIAYQWRRNDSDVPGATDSFLHFARISSADAGSYTLIASNSQGMITSEVAVVSVDAFRVLYGLLEQNVTEGHSFTLQVQVESALPLFYQWYHNGNAIAGANSSIFQVGYATTNDAGLYSVILSNSVGATNLEARIYVYPHYPYFVQTLRDQWVPEGATAAFVALADGGPPPSYYWFLNGTPLNVPNSPELLLVNVTTNDQGHYWVIASNYTGWASNGAWLAVSPAGPADRWTVRNPLPQPNDLLDLAYGNGLYVAVGMNGALLTSTNAEDWQLQRSHTAEHLHGVAYGSGRFVAVGDNVVLSSTNGTDWLKTYPGVAQFSGVTFGNGRFVACQNSSFLVSSNGLDWTTTTVSAYGLAAVTFGDGLFVAAGYNSFSGLFTSTNALDWSFQSLGIYSALDGVRYAGGRFVLVGDAGLLYTSNDGSQWIKRNVGATRRLLNVDYGNGAYVVVGVRGVIYKSSDLLHWTAVDSGTPDRLEAVVFAQNKFTVVGESGTTLTSVDGSTWVKQGIGTRLDLDGITIGDGGLVMAVGKGGTVITTSNGTNLLMTTAGITNELHGVTFATWREPVNSPSLFRTIKRYVAVGDSGMIITSDNGIDWVQRYSSTNTSLKGVTYGKGLFVAVGSNGAILTSPDAINWTRELSPASLGDFNEVAYGNGVFVGVTDKAYAWNIIRSPDGHHWVQDRLGGVNMRGVTFGQDRFGIVGNDGSAYFSADGTNWQISYTPTTRNGDNLRGITYANGLWCIVGNLGIILTSPSGESFTWNRGVSPVIMNLHGVRYLQNGTLLAIGNAGTVLQSERFAPLLEGARAPGGYQLTIHPGMGSTLRLQKSANLSIWIDLTTFTNPPEPTSFLDTSVTNGAFFYRALTPLRPNPSP